MKTNPLTLLPAAIRAMVLGLGLAGVLSTQAAPASPQGVITEKLYFSIEGVNVVDLTASPKFPDQPDLTSYRPYFELNATGDILSPTPGDVYNNYGSQMAGYFYPPVTGDYTFWLCADDGASLYLSTDDTATNRKLIAQETGWSNPRNYTTVGWGSLPDKCSLTFTGTEWDEKDTANGGAKITLVAGRAYYIEALQKEGGGGDNLSVAVQDPAGLINTTMPIPGQYLSSIDKNSGPPVFAAQPQSQTVDEGAAVSFMVSVDGTPPYTYQWMRNGTAIPGATGPAYTIARVFRTDDGAEFSVAVTALGGSVTSAAATLSVIPDSTPPRALAVQGSASMEQVTVSFSEPLDPETAQAIANYQIPGLTVLAAALSPVPDDNVVVLTTTLQAEGTRYGVAIENVKDLPGNIIAQGGTATFTSYVFKPEVASYERWNTDLYVFPDLATFAANVAAGSVPPPDITSEQTQLAAPRDVSDWYTARVSTWFTPPEDGDYVFFIASDDGAYLYLSPDQSRANKKLVAYETGWSPAYWFTISGGSDLQAKRSDQFWWGTQWPQIDPATLGARITLTGGHRYYMEILMVEGQGGDGAEVTYIKRGEPEPPNDPSAMRLHGALIGTYVAPPGVPVAAANAVPNPVEVGQAVQLDGTGSYHEEPGRSIVNWEWDLDNDGQFDVAGAVITTSFSSVGTHVVTLRVTDDSTPPMTDVTTVEVQLLPPPGKPVAVASAVPNPVELGKPVQLDGSGSYHENPARKISQWEWDLDNDGTFDATGQVITAQFAVTGTHIVALRVTDDSTPPVTAQTAVEVQVLAPPVAVAKANPNPVEVGKPVKLDGTASYHQDPARKIVKWEWDINNDGVFDLTGPAITVPFGSKGIRPVTLRVTDDSSPPMTSVTTVEMLVAEKLVPWKGQGTGQLILVYGGDGSLASATVREQGAATHIGKYSETVRLTSPTTGEVEIIAANGDKLFGDLLHLSPVEVQVTIRNGTGRFKGAIGRYVATITMTGPTSFTATATGSISSVGSGK